MVKVGIYCRLSNEDKEKQKANDDSMSIYNQKLLLIDYADNNKWEIYDVYSDDGYSGLDRNRPEFNRMIDDARKHRFDIILCKNLSRFSRDNEEVLKFTQRKFPEWDITFHSVEDHIDSDDPDSVMPVQFYGLMNETYSRLVSKNIRVILKNKQMRGDFIGSYACYGYERNPLNKSKLKVDEEAAIVVKRIFSLYNGGIGTMEIARILNKENIPCPAKYKKLKYPRYTNRYLESDDVTWTRKVIQKILKNEAYIGTMVQHKREKISYKIKKMKDISEDEQIRVEDAHEAIIDKETFSQVQQRLKSRQRSTGKGEVHIFAGRARCMNCGGIMSKFGNGQSYQYLRCNTPNVNQQEHVCESNSIRFDYLQQVVTKEVARSITELCDTNKIVGELFKNNYNAQKVDHEKKKLSKLKVKMEENKRVRKELYTDKAKGRITQEEYDEFNNDFYAEQQALTLKIEQLQSNIKELEGCESPERYDNIANKYGKLEALTHTIVSELINYIEIGALDKATNERKINIHWNF